MPRLPLPRLMLPFLLLPALVACAGGAGRVAGETEDACVHRLYDYPSRSEPFQTAANECAGKHPIDLTGDRYYQLLASSLNMPYVTHDPVHDATITLTGSRIPQPTNEPPPPELRLY